LTNTQNNKEKLINISKKFIRNKTLINNNYFTKKELITSLDFKPNNNKTKSLDFIKEDVIKFYSSKLGIKLNKELISFNITTPKTKIYKVKLKDNKTYYLIERITNKSIIEFFNKSFIQSASRIIIINGSMEIIKKDPIVLFRPNNNHYSYIINKSLNKKEIVDLLKNEVISFSLEFENKKGSNSLKENKEFKKTRNSFENKSSNNLFIFLFVLMLFLLLASLILIIKILKKKKIQKKKSD